MTPRQDTSNRENNWRTDPMGKAFHQALQPPQAFYFSENFAHRVALKAQQRSARQRIFRFLSIVGCGFLLIGAFVYSLPGWEALQKSVGHSKPIATFPLFITAIGCLILGNWLSKRWFTPIKKPL